MQKLTDEAKARSGSNHPAAGGITRHKGEGSEFGFRMDENEVKAGAIRRAIENAGPYGGGDIGRIGVTPVELSGLVKGTGSAKHNLGAIIDANALADYIAGEVHKILAHYARNRMFG
jgi:hypothetical protein